MLYTFNWATYPTKTQSWNLVFKNETRQICPGPAWFKLSKSCFFTVKKVILKDPIQFYTVQPIILHPGSPSQMLKYSWKSFARAAKGPCFYFHSKKMSENIIIIIEFLPSSQIAALSKLYKSLTTSAAPLVLTVQRLGRGSAEEWERSEIAQNPPRSFYCAAPPSLLGVSRPAKGTLGGPELQHMMVGGRTAALFGLINSFLSSITVI